MRSFPETYIDPKFLIKTAYGAMRIEHRARKQRKEMCSKWGMGVGRNTWDF